MPSTLRKSCHACNTAKRKCIPQLPACDRCTKKDIACVYDNVPVNQAEQTKSTVSEGNGIAGTSQPISGTLLRPSPIKFVYDSVSTARDACMAALANGEATSSAEARPMLTTDGEVVHWLTTFYSQVARNGLDMRSSPFVHPCVFRRELKSCPPPASRFTEEGASCEEQEETINVWKERQIIENRLVEIHNLTTTSLSRLLLEKPSNKKDLEVEELVRQLFTKTQNLWQAAPSQLNEAFQPWEAWVVAESIRRSMFSAIMIRGLWYAAAHGYVYYEPFFESIPFDPRAGVWEAETEEDWNQRIRERGGGHTKLKSYHEFIETSGLKLKLEEDGAFQRMLFICYNGSGGIRALEELDKSYDRNRA